MSFLQRTGRLYGYRPNVEPVFTAGSQQFLPAPRSESHVDEERRKKRMMSLTVRLQEKKSKDKTAVFNMDVLSYLKEMHYDFKDSES